ncbi:MAG: Lrp/AsnC family transcriptional regulator [bacterium]|nr:Lrp/AsnC family transcriptional regulator [bacterium]
MRYLQQTQTEDKVKLDIKDKKILSLLSQNARANSSTIAKEVVLSRDTVAYRLENYQKKGLIQGYRTVVDIGLFGYDAYHIFLQLNKPTEEIEKKLIQKFQEFSFMRAIIKFSGKFDFELAVIAKGLQDFDRILDDILTACSHYLQDYLIVARTETYVGRVFPRSFYDYKQAPQKKVESNGVILDALDKKLLTILADDATASYQFLAKKTGLSPDAIAYRIKKLLQEGVILKFIPVINYAALSYNIYAVLLRISGLDIKRKIILKNFLKENPHILWAVKCVGRFNVLSYICVNTTEELNQTIIQLRNIIPDTLIDYEVLIAYEEYKYTYFPDYALL